MDKQIWTIIAVALVVAIVASLITASITGNTIKVSSVSSGYEIYTKAEVDGLIRGLQTQLDNHINGGAITCRADTDCGTTAVRNYCFNSSTTCNATTRYSCIQPGTINSYCTNTTASVCGECPYNTNCTGAGVCSSTTVQPIVCSDTDGGINYNLKGTTKSSAQSNWPYNDSCYIKTPQAAYKQNLSGTGIVEYYCTTSKYVRNINNDTVCTHGCYDGACRSAP